MANFSYKNTWNTYNYSSKQHRIELHIRTSLTSWVYFSLQAEIADPACRLKTTAGEGSPAVVFPGIHGWIVDASLHTYTAMEVLAMTKQQGKQRSCCCQPYNTAYYMLHFRICRVINLDAVDFWCLPLLTHFSIFIHVTSYRERQTF